MGGDHVQVEESDAHVTGGRQAKIQIYQEWYLYYPFQHDRASFYGHHGMIAQDSSFAQVQEYTEEIDEAHHCSSLDLGPLFAGPCPHCNPHLCFFF